MSTLRTLLLIGSVLAAAQHASAAQLSEADLERAVIAAESPHYVIEDLPAPPSGEVLEVGCLQTLPGDRLAVGTRRGTILIAHHVSSPDPRQITWTVFARGLMEPLGMQWRDKEKALYVMQKPEFTKLQDLDNDGAADHFETITDRWGLNGNYHEFAFCAPPDADGSTWITLCLTGSFTSDDRWRGWAMKIGADGSVTPAASGIRSPGGMGKDADGNTYYTDNQGRWHGTSCLSLLTPGSFQGTFNGNRWYADAPNMGPEPIAALPESRIEAERARIPQLVPPAILIPHGLVGQSPSGIICDTTGALGPFKNQLFVAEQTFSQIQRVYIERINGVAQGMIIPFKSGFSTGGIALQLLSNGMVYIGGTNRGWGARGGKSYDLQRMRYTGTAPFEIERINIAADGFDVRFTAAVDPATAKLPASYAMSAWSYIYHEGYGSPRVDQITPTITSAVPTADGLTVHLTVKGWHQGSVHQIDLPGVRSKKGAPLLHPTAYYTINEIPHAKSAN